STSCSATSQNCDETNELYEKVKREGGLCHTAHPATSWEGQNATDWSVVRDEVEVAGEIYANETKMIEAWSNYSLKLGVVGVSDTHDGRPGSSGITGCYASELTRKGILEALKARRCFATSSGANRTHFPMNLSFKINGHWMGEEISLNYGSKLNFEIIVNATYNVTRIYIKKNGETIATKTDCNFQNCAWFYSSFADTNSYYYVVATTSAGKSVWSSPIFISLSNLVTNPSFEGNTWQVDPNNTNFEDWEISRYSHNGLIKTWVETSNVHSGSKAFGFRTEAPSSTNISLSISSNRSKLIPIDENKYLEAGLWAYVKEGYYGDDISIVFYFENGSSIRLWGQDKLGGWNTGMWSRVSYLWYPSSLGEGKGYIPKGAKYARIVIFCNYHEGGIKERIYDDVFVKQHDNYPGWKERLEKNFTNLKLLADYNKFLGVSNLSYGVHDDKILYLGNETFLEKIRALNFSYIRFQYKYYEACKYWNETTHSCKEYDWTKVDKLIEAIKATGAEPIICVAGGDIGSSTFDPNKSYWLPPGMTGNYSGTGYPSHIDFGNYIADIVRHLNVEKGYNVKYWEIWNEPSPTVNIDEFVNLFNNAQRRMHEIDPTIKISNDRIMTNLLADEMLEKAEGVGFLSFHHYAAGGTCMYPHNSSNLENIFYPPNDVNGWDRDETIMYRVNRLGTDCSSWWCTYSPKKARELWKQKTGKDLEVIGTELNLNSAWRNGTDHRQNNIFGATWWAAKVKAYILDGFETSLVYFTVASWDRPEHKDKPMAKYGGFGFGMMNSSYPYNPYAPYWSMYLLTTYIPKGSKLYFSKSSDSDVIDILAVESRGSKNILLINKVNETVNFTLPILGFTIKNATLHILDKTTYVQRYEPSLDRTIIYKSSIDNISLTKNNVQDFTFNGYTVAVLEAFPDLTAPYIKSVTDIDLKSVTWQPNRYSIKSECQGSNTIQVYSNTKPSSIKIGNLIVPYDDSLSSIPSWKYDRANKIITINFSC
ncbi:MAG: hypothetical protein QXZ59_04975, partial [Nitrososphaeria archaeon]